MALMKNKQRKSFVATILILVLTVLISACSSGNSGATNSESAGKGESSAPAETTKNKTTNIRFTIWYGNGDIEIWEQVIKEFQQENPDIRVDFEPINWGEYWTRLQTQLGAGAAPDVVGMAPGIVFDYIDRGQLAELDSFFDKSSHKLDEIPDSLTVEGASPADTSVHYALPWRFAAGALFANRDAFENAGIPFPTDGWTVQEFEEAAIKLSGNGKFGFRMPSFTMNAALLAAFGGSPVTEDRSGSAFNSPEMLKYYEWLQDLLFKKKAILNPRDEQGGVDPFVSQQVAMAYGGSWEIPVYREIKDFKWDVLPDPTLDGKSATYAGPDMISITKDSDKKEAAWKFVEFSLFNDKAQQLLGSTGMPIRKDDLLNEEKIAEIAAQGPANYKKLIDGAIKQGIGYAFIPQFPKLQTLVNDATYLMVEREDADIQAILNDLHQQVNAEIARK